MKEAPDLRLFPNRRLVVSGPQQAVFPDLSFRLLRLLGERAPADVSYAEIEAAVWGAQVTRETLKQRVKLVREELTALGVSEGAIEAVRNVGYRTPLTVAVLEGAAPDRRTRWWVSLVFLLLLLTGAWWWAATRDVSAPLTIAIATEPAADDPAWPAVRRALVRSFARMDGMRVIDGARPVSDLVARLTQEPGQRLSIELVDRHSGAVLIAENYAYDPADYDRALLHFSNKAHSAFGSLSVELGRRGFPRQPAAVRSRYLGAVGLARRDDAISLDAARRQLEAVLTAAPDFALATALLARVKADQVRQHGAPAALAVEAERDAIELVSAYPEVAEFRFALARAKLARGDKAGAVAELRAAEPAMPFLSREIVSIERQH